MPDRAPVENAAQPAQYIALTPGDTIFLGDEWWQPRPGDWVVIDSDSLLPGLMIGADDCLKVRRPIGMISPPTAHADGSVTPTTIFGKPVAEYVHEQFPATIGHIPLDRYFTVVAELHEKYTELHTMHFLKHSIKCSGCEKMVSSAWNGFDGAWCLSCLAKKLTAANESIASAIDQRDKARQDADGERVATALAVGDRMELRKEFQNFHRLLCERFDCTHDPVAWRRDQISLIEWIAKRFDASKVANDILQPPPPVSLAGAVEKARESMRVAELALRNSISLGCGRAEGQVGQLVYSILYAQVERLCPIVREVDNVATILKGEK